MKVSILIPCYNAERWIAQAIESALAQTWQPSEVIVVDDGSTDASLQRIRQFEGQIRWETGPNRGGNAARNRLLELADGEWLQYLDADDYLLPEKVAQQAAFVGNQPEVDVLFGPVTLEHTDDLSSPREQLEIPEPHDPWILLARWYLPQTGAVLWKKEAIASVGGWKEDQPCCQEHELYFRLLEGGKRFQYFPSGGAVYRQWSQQTVCTRDVPELHRRRLAIEDAAETHLRQCGELTQPRQHAINQARFEVARIAWQYAPQLAADIMRDVRQSDQRFVPGGPAAPPHYRLAFQLLGFRGAQRVADWRRRWVGKEAVQ